MEINFKKDKEKISSLELIYLASPYTSFSADPVQRKKDHQKNFEAVRDCKASLMQRGLLVVSLIVACHPVSIAHDLPGDYDYWHKLNLRLMLSCDTLAVLKLSGWEKSKGLCGEIEHAVAWGKKIIEVHPITYEISNFKG